MEERLLIAEATTVYHIARRRDDELWKGILEDVFEDFLRFFFPNAEDHFDFEKKLVFLDKEFNRLFPPECGAAGVRFVDKLVKVHLKEGGSRFILIHVEIQGQKGHEDLRARMFRYFYRAKDKHNVSIGAFAILIDDDSSYHPKVYQEEYLGTRLSYEFNTYKLLQQDEQELRDNPNPFSVVALVVLMALKHKNVEDEDLKQIKLDLTRELLKRKVERSKHIKIMDFLTYYVNFKNKEMMIKFEKETEQLTGRSIPMGVREILLDRAKNEGLEIGRQEGRQEGREEERAKALAEKKRMAAKLKQRAIAPNDIAEITGLSIREIEAL